MTYAPCPQCGETEYVWANTEQTNVICSGCGHKYRLEPSFRFTAQDENFIRAVELGCTPVLAPYDWQCRCPGAPHGISTTQNAITPASLARATAEMEAR